MVQGVREPSEPIPEPNEEAIKLVGKLNKAKQILMEDMKEFNKMLTTNILAENKSIKEQEREQSIINNMIKSALKVEHINQGEGLLGLCVLAIRQGLSLRDAGNRLAYQIDQLRKEVEYLKTQKTKSTPTPEDILLEKAKELGLKVKFEK